jgi:hypothetical protein
MPWRNVDNLAVSIGHLYTQFTQLHIEDMFVSAYMHSLACNIAIASTTNFHSN